jgi:hypothetical protein
LLLRCRLPRWIGKGKSSQLVANFGIPERTAPRLRVC